MRTWLKRLWRQSKRVAARPQRRVLRVEQLEYRLAPAGMTFTVTTTSDDNDAMGTPPGPDMTLSLREAILAANANPTTANSPNVINFNISMAGTVQTINVGGTAGMALPALMTPTTINGYSEMGASANTQANSDNAKILIQIDGTNAGTAVDGLILGAGSGGSTIKGLDITNFQADSSFNGGVGILVQSSGNSILGNFIGVDPTGATEMPNGSDGIRVVDASNNQIGSTNPADRNIVSGNTLDGIHVEGTQTAAATVSATGALITPATSTSMDNTIDGNFVGVASDGVSSVGVRTVPVPNAGALGSKAGDFLFGIKISGGDSNTIGGPAAGARNVVGFCGAGIEVDNGGQSNTIQGNFSGVGADGTTPIGNLLHGIVLRSSNGFNAPLGPAQPNEPGVSYNLIGGTAAGDGNTLEFNGTGGIAVFGNSVSASNQANIGNAIEENSVFENGRSYLTASSAPTPLLGIDLTNQFKFPRDDGFTPNDSQGHGAANDPNNFQNFPVLTSAIEDGAGNTDITGTFSEAGEPNTTLRIEFFSSAPDPLGLPAEGQTFIGFTNVSTDANGKASFSVTLPVKVFNGRLITATATDPNGNTSEFSAGVTVTTPPPPLLPPSPPPPFVSVALGPQGDVLDIVSASGTFIQNDRSGAHVVGTGVRSASVAFDSHNRRVLVVVLSNGEMLQFDRTGTHVLGFGVRSAAVSFGKHGEVLDVVLQNGTLLQFDSSGNHVLANGIASVSVAFNHSREVLEMVTPGLVLVQFDASGGHMLGTGILGAGVAFGHSGEVLDLILQDDSLIQFDANGVHLLGKLF
jgi:hypothetical protein